MVAGELGWLDLTVEISLVDNLRRTCFKDKVELEECFEWKL